MPLRGSPNGAGHTRPQPGRDRPEQVVAINRNRWSQSAGMRRECLDHIVGLGEAYQTTIRVDQGTQFVSGSYVGRPATVWKYWNGSFHK